MDIIKRIWGDKTRMQHFLYAMPIGLVFTILCVLGVATALEFKDKAYGGKWDWSDWAWTMIGGAIGQVVQAVIVYFIFFR